MTIQEKRHLISLDLAWCFLVLEITTFSQHVWTDPGSAQLETLSKMKKNSRSDSSHGAGFTTGKYLTKKYQLKSYAVVLSVPLIRLSVGSQWSKNSNAIFAGLSRSCGKKMQETIPQNLNGWDSSHPSPNGWLWVAHNVYPLKIQFNSWSI